MNGGFYRQRGAVTLIGALFLVMTLALMIQVLHRSAGSDILDTAMQNDAVEALFVAETGIEHASFLYANGSGCAGLNGVSANAGRGSFTITSAFMVGSDCRIRVRGSVGSTTLQANRTVDADLQLASSDGWIVGDNGTILRWNGAGWNSVTSPTTDDLFDVFCVSASACRAVGANGRIIHWDGSNWSTVSSGTTRDLFAVSCEPGNPSNCFAAGGDVFGFLFFIFSQSIILGWDGSSWSTSGTLFNFGDWRFQDLACPSTTCYVVTANGFIARYNPGTGSWGNDNSNLSVPLHGIACNANDDCWAVGDNSGNNWNLDYRNASGWTPVSVPVTNQANQNLNAVSCINSNDCWAVGDRDANRYVLGHWNGSNWSQVTLTNASQRENLNAVHCLGSNDCWAVGDYRNGGNVLHYDGSGWSYTGATVPNNTNLNGIHFPPGAGSGGGGGAVSLVRWQEVISN